MRVTSARFTAGAAAPGRIPAGRLPEVAFAGRSNVGKSSLLNRLVGRRALARVSKTPGRTQQLNFFSIDERLVFVDLPGYGFARVSRSLREGWKTLVEGYLTSRRVLRAVVVIVDVRRGVEPDDADLLDFLRAHDVPAILVATKIDKLKRGERATALRELVAARPGEPPLAFSSETGEGLDELWGAIESAVAARRRP